MKEQSRKDQQPPYKSLGTQLKRMREKKQETLAEVSGAVEIDATVLADIEQGMKRPSEDILMLLISHFAVKDQEAVKLWELAGYTPRADDDGPMSSDGKDGSSQHVFVMPMDARIVYADMFHVMVNDYGVVMNFMQGAGPRNQPLAIGRVGMSREHALSVLELLQSALFPEPQDNSPKLLAAPEDVKSRDTPAEDA